MPKRRVCFGKGQACLARQDDGRALLMAGDPQGNEVWLKVAEAIDRLADDFGSAICVETAPILTTASPVREA
jgi:hypothetical protein